MKGNAEAVIEFAIGCKFNAAFCFCPVFARFEEFFCEASSSVRFFDENAFEIACGRRDRSLHVIAPESALSEADGFSVDAFYKAGAVVVRKDRRKLVLEFA